MSSFKLSKEVFFLNYFILFFNFGGSDNVFGKKEYYFQDISIKYHSLEYFSTNKIISYISKYEQIQQIKQKLFINAHS